MPHRRKKIVFALAATFLVFLCLEGLAFSALALWPSLINSNIETQAGDEVGGMPFDKDLLWRLPANREEKTQPNDRGRILFLGDSSVYGFGVNSEDNFVSKTASCLNRKVENAGVPGYSSTQIRIQFERILSHSPPDMVVVAALWSDMMQSQWTDRELYLKFGERNWAERLDSEILWSRSALYRLIRGLRLKAKGDRIENPKIFWNAIQRGDPNMEGPRVPLVDYRRNLEAIHSLAAKEGVEVLTLLLPTNRSEPQPDQAIHYRSTATQLAQDRQLMTIDMDLIFDHYNEEEINERFIDVVHPSVMGHKDISVAICQVLSSKTKNGSNQR